MSIVVVNCEAGKAEEVLKGVSSLVGDCKKCSCKEAGNRFEVVAAALDYAKSMFIYHAGQRHTSIRFYFVALAIVVAGFVNLITSENAAMISTRRLVSTVLGVGGEAISKTSNAIW